MKYIQTTLGSSMQKDLSALGTDCGLLSSCWKCCRAGYFGHFIGENQHNIIKGCSEVPGEFSMHRINIGKSRKKMITRMNLYLQCLLEGYQCLVFCVLVQIPNLVLVQEIEVNKLFIRFS